MKYFKTFAALGVLASIAASAPAPPPATATEIQEIVMTHTVSIDDMPAAPTESPGAVVGYGVEMPSQSAGEGEQVLGYAAAPAPTLGAASGSQAGPTSTQTGSGHDSGDADTEAAFVAAPTMASAHAHHTATSASGTIPTETLDPALDIPTGEPTNVNTTAAVDQPVAPVVPVRICTENGTTCLTTSDSEFSNVELSFDTIAEFSLGLDGLLVRLSDLKCVDAVSQDDGAFYEMQFNNCTLPNYLQGALIVPGNGIDSSNTTTDISGSDRGATLTAATTPTPTATADTTADSPTLEAHSVWFYNTTGHLLCANVNDGLGGDIVKVCLYSDDGYASLGNEKDLRNVKARDRTIDMPVAENNLTLSEQIELMLKAMTYDGSVFWYDSWNTNFPSVLKYKTMGTEADVDMGTSGDLGGIVWPLWSVINDCRSLCDVYAFCHSFTFKIQARVCRLSSFSPEVDPTELDTDTPDMVTFVQNANYNRLDYVLPEDIILEPPHSETGRMLTVKGVRL